MGKYMFHTSYTGKGLVGLLKEGGSRRRAALTQTIESMGGTVEGLYYAFGDTDLYIIADLPDDATATAVSLNIGNAGALSIKCTVLITPETVDEAVKKKVAYRPPGARATRGQK
ncbi:MAG: GYD domain-containing protein [Deltaproteobacteria bacterium]|nr:GYD domain-containing protein [Deltaproteobacteria bacterium]